MLEQLIKDLIAALNANTAAQGGKAPAADAAAASTDAGTTTAGKAGRKPKADAAPKGATREETVAALTEVKDKFGSAEAKAIITKVGAAKMAEIADDKLDAAFKLAKAKLEATTDDDEGGGDDDGL